MGSAGRQQLLLRSEGDAHTANAVGVATHPLMSHLRLRGAAQLGPRQQRCRYPQHSIADGKASATPGSAAAAAASCSSGGSWNHRVALCRRRSQLGAEGKHQFRRGRALGSRCRRCAIDVASLDRRCCPQEPQGACGRCLLIQQAAALRGS